MIKVIKFYQEIRTGSSLPLIVGEFGEETREKKNMICDRLSKQKNQVKFLTKTLEELRVLVIETEEERRLRTLKNKQAFEQKVGKL